jgi:hypothetical protein
MSDPVCDYIPIQPIDLKTIDGSDKYYQISVSNECIDLCKSIKNIGLIHPPTIQKIPAKNVYRIISGFQRIQACIQLKMKLIPCYVFSESSSSFACAKRAIADNCHKPMNVLEQSKCLALIEKTLPHHLSINDAAEQIDFPVSTKAMKRIRPLCDMFPCIQKGIANNYIALPVAHKLTTFAEKDALEFTRLFEQLHPGLNIQREILTYCDEISKRDHISIAEIVNDVQVQKILSDDIDRKQKIHFIRMLLKSKRYPRFSDMEKKVVQQIEQLQLKKTIKLLPPQYFESNYYELHIGFTHTDELKESLKDMLTKTDAIETILGLSK